MPTETRNLQLLERLILLKLFSVHHFVDCGSNIISFSPDLQKDIQHPIIHSPLQQLSAFYSSWGGLLPPNVTEKKKKKPKTRLNAQKINELNIISKLTGAPTDLFNSLQFDKVEDKYDKIIKNAKRVKLLGAISLPSVYDVISWLKDKEFCGLLEVYDISSIPIKVGQLYKELGLLPTGIRVDFINESALELKKEEQTDLIISDVLGYYLTPEEYSKLASAVASNLRDGGIWLTRELIEPDAMVSVDLRSIGRNSSKYLAEFNDFIKKLFGFTLELKVLEEFQKTKWARVSQYTRKTKEEYLSPIPNNLVLESSIAVTSKSLWNAENKRLFQTFVFKKQLK